MLRGLRRRRQGASSIPSVDWSSTGGTDPNRPDRVLVRFSVDGILAVGKPQRVPVGLADADGLLLTDTPAQLTFQVVTDGRQGDRVAHPGRSSRRGTAEAVLPVRH